jgi:hypothetical protein
MAGHVKLTGNSSITHKIAFTLISVAYAGLAGAATIPATTALPLPLQAITSRMAQVDEEKHANLPDFVVMRKYILHNSRMKRDAEMVVRVSYSKAHGKTFQVVEASGVEGISKKVFQHLIEAEKEASKADNRARGSINPQNYTFELVGTEILDGRRCYVLNIHPKMKTKYVFNGKVWVDAEDFAVAKLEGHPAANISFWVGKPLITQTWRKTGEFWMAASNCSRSESRILGSSELTVQNTDYRFGSTTAALNQKLN